MGASVVVGVVGSGAITKKTVSALLADRLSTVDESRFIFPVTDEHWTPAVRSAAQYAVTRELPYEVIVDGSEADLDGVDDVLEGAATTHKVTAVESKLVTLLAEASAEDAEGILLMAWDDKDDVCQRALARALKRDVGAFDMLDGLNKLSFDDDPEPVAEPEREREFEDRQAAQEAAAADREPPVALEEEKPKRKRRTKAEMEAARAAEAAANEVTEGEVVDSGLIALTAVAEEAQEIIEGLSIADVVAARPPIDAAVSLFAMSLEDLLTLAARAGAEAAIQAMSPAATG